MLTPIVYRPKKVIYLLFHVELFCVLLFESNVWIHILLIHVLFSYWYPVFLEDFVSWKKSSLTGFGIITLLGLACVSEQHVSEQVMIGVVACTFIYLFVPCVHAWVRIKTPTRVTPYEGRKGRVCQV